MYTVLALLVVASMLVAACGGAAPAAPAAEAPAVEAPAAEAAATEAPAEEAAAEAPAAEEPAAAEAMTETVEIDPNRVQVRWFVGLGSGTDPQQQAVQQEVVEEFNASQDEIQLIMEVVPYDGAKDALSTQIASGAGPDIVGPVGWGGSNAFAGQWMDLTPLIEEAGYDTTQFSDELVKFYVTEEGQVGLPFAVFPAAVFFQKAMFDEAGLNYPPAEYGEPYVWPDGTEEEWSFDTLTKVAKILTVDENGNSPLMLDDAGAVVPGEDFDPTKIVQYGYVPQYQDAIHVAAFFGAESDVAADGTAQFPEQHKDAWKWEYEGIFGDEPFIPSDPVVQSPDFGAGNAFNSGKIAMALTQQWYTCCLGSAGENWDLAIIPTHNGVVNGRVDADTFRILKDTQHPAETFTVLSYLIGEASDKLLQTYGGMPARAEALDAFYEAKAEQFPWVENWDTIRAGLAYPDIPSAESNRPNWLEFFDRQRTFQYTYRATPDLDMDQEIANFEADATAIFQKGE
jgi:multiple sugar transport system substrate-binding protein